MKLRRVYSTPNVDSAQRVLQAARGAGLDNDALSLIARSDIEVEGVPDERKDAKTDFLPAAAAALPPAVPRAWSQDWSPSRCRRLG